MTPYSNEYTLKNGRKLIVRQPVAADAEGLIALIQRVDTESRFLGREPGEFDFTPDRERELIEAMLTVERERWFVAEYEGEIVGQCSVAIRNRRYRFAHRAVLGIMVRADCWGLGIGGRLMREAIAWCRGKGLEQLELEVVDGNERAIAMYESFGFVKTGAHPRGIRYADGTYADELFMVLRL